VPELRYFLLHWVVVLSTEALQWRQCFT